MASISGWLVLDASPSPWLVLVLLLAWCSGVPIVLDLRTLEDWSNCRDWSTLIAFIGGALRGGLHGGFAGDWMGKMVTESDLSSLSCFSEVTQCRVLGLDSLQ